MVGVSCLTQSLRGGATMNTWLELIIIWLILDIFIIASVWVAVNIIKPRYPKLWKRMIVDREPDRMDFYK
jgi:hypothetical protein